MTRTWPARLSESWQASLPGPGHSESAGAESVGLGLLPASPLIRVRPSDDGPSRPLPPAPNASPRGLGLRLSLPVCGPTPAPGRAASAARASLTSQAGRPGPVCGGPEPLSTDPAVGRIGTRGARATGRPHAAAAVRPPRCQVGGARGSRTRPAAPAPSTAVPQEHPSLSLCVRAVRGSRGGGAGRIYGPGPGAFRVTGPRTRRSSAPPPSPLVQTPPTRSPAAGAGGARRSARRGRGGIAP